MCLAFEYAKMNGEMNAVHKEYNMEEGIII